MEVRQEYGGVLAAVPVGDDHCDLGGGGGRGAVASGEAGVAGEEGRGAVQSQGDEGRAGLASPALCVLPEAG